MQRKITKFVKQNFVLILILLLATGLRFYKLTQVPPSLNWDEISHGYNAYSILKTGKDEWGKFLPTIFRAYGDYKLPVYIYLTSFSVGLFGLNTFAVRTPSVLVGIAIVLFTYLLTKEIFSSNRKNQKRNCKHYNDIYHCSGHQIGLVAAFLVAIEPWSFFLSRGAFEANLAQAFIVIGVYFFLKSFRTICYILHATIFLGLSVWTYNSARVFVPLLLLGMILIYRKQLLEIYKKNKTLATCYILLATFFFLPMFFQLINPAGQARYGWVAIVDEGAISQIIEARNNSNLRPTITRLVYNRLTFFVSQFVKNYLSHISGNFLFFKGGSHYQFSVPGHGLLYPINLIFLLIGVFLLLKKRDKASLLLLTWFYLAPIPSSLTRESPHVLRAITFLPTPMILSAIGLSWFLKKFQGKAKVTTTMIYIIVVGLFLVNYLNNYFGDYKRNYSWSWQYGYEQAVDYARENYDKYDKIIVTKKYGEPHEFFLFHWPWDPAKFQSDPNLIRFNQSNWYWVDSFDKFYFVNDWQIVEKGTGNYDFNLESGEVVDCLNEKCLLITSPENAPNDWKKIETINFLDGKTAFEIFGN
ncbi:glycosyltransferase family 39 protein [Patescibacteria group bacterium]|nr:glycosyltransferase family 39 protein [Patescibacteria group bacterium]